MSRLNGFIQCPPLRFVKKEKTIVINWYQYKSQQSTILQLLSLLSTRDRAGLTHSVKVKQQLSLPCH